MMMKRQFALIGAIALSAVLFASPGLAQNVTYHGTLRIGFGDSDNGTNHQTNDAIPVCAATNPFLPQTFGTLDVWGEATQAGPGGAAGAALVFAGQGVGGDNGPNDQGQAGSGQGGAEVKVNATCNVVIPPFAGTGRLRSRTQVGAAKWPGVRGPFQTAAGVAVDPQITPAATPVYTVAAANGATAGNFTIPFMQGNGNVTVMNGGVTYGGGIPFQGGGAVNLGVNKTNMTGGGGLLMTFGVTSYVKGILPTDPQIFGTDKKGRYDGNPGAFTPGAIVGQGGLALTLRTKGGSTIDQHGFIATIGGVGGNTDVCDPCGANIITPALFAGAFFEWTTGTVMHQDNVGDYATTRTGMGHDRVGVAMTGTQGLGTTRQLQMVSPWSATIDFQGPFGLALDLGFGGLAVLDLDIIPSPEPGSMALIGFGVAGLMGLGAMRRRN